ncbi:MAG: ABC1 kinase family protein [Actinomycetes bacterium]
MVRRPRDHGRRRRERARARRVLAVVARGLLGAVADLRRRPRGPALAQRTRCTIEQLGPTFIKLGQVLSTRPDLLPDRLAAELARLQDHAPVVSAPAIEAAVAAGLGAGPTTAFASFDLTPLAAASIGQVHAATLADGAAVVVKVRRPGVLDTIDLDLALLDRTARRVARVSRLARRYDVRGLADRFARTLRAECDYRLEGRNAEVIAAAVASLPGVVVPRIDWGHTCGSVLTEARVEGVKIDDLAALERMGVDRTVVAATFADLYLTMVFGDGFFHADPHPGNVFVAPDGTVGLVDFGMTGRVEPETRAALGGVLLALVATDARGLADALLGLGMATREVDRPRLERDLGALLADYAHRPLEELPVAEVLGRVMAVVRRHRLRLPADLALLVKTVMMCEGVALRLDPRFLLVPRLLPFAARLAADDSDGSASAG